MPGRELPTRCAFVLCKLRVCGSTHYLLTYDPKWNDLNLLGGHEETTDYGNLCRTAARELAEELGRSLQATRFELIPLTEAIPHGPVWSPSARKVKEYLFKFYAMRFVTEPKIEAIVSKDTPLLRLIREEDLLTRRTDVPISSVLTLIDKHLAGGIKAVPYSWSLDLCDREGTAKSGQDANLEQKIQCD